MRSTQNGDVRVLPYTACRADQRFGYYLLIPSGLEEGRQPGSSSNPARLIVAVHGTLRDAAECRDAFSDLARRHNCAVLAPLFPAGIDQPGELNNYKFLEYNGIRFDHLLSSMIEEVGARFAIDAARLFLFGFSGGAHFAHRFLYLHPERLAGVSIAAPGMVTLLEFERRWHCGLADAEARFGKSIDVEAIRSVPVQMIVGDRDIDGREIIIERESPLWMPGVNDAGTTRIARLQALRDSFAAHDIAVRYDLVPGATHEQPPLIPGVTAFFDDLLTRNASGSGQETDGAEIG